MRDRSESRTAIFALPCSALRPLAAASAQPRGTLVYGVPIIDSVIRVVRVPYVVEQDGDGVWCASARLRPCVATFGERPMWEAAMADLGAGLGLPLDEVYGPGGLACEDPAPFEEK